MYSTPQHQSAEAVVSVSSLGKAYKIYPSKRDRAKQLIFQNRRKYFQEHWALRNISFDLRRGESIGIVGKNGSGKSTLLQLICGTLKPSQGEVIVNGKIAALLELGSGFNPEFSGRENVYLNASLLGLNKQEIQERLDDILAFADIGNYVDQPVRAYSSGMVVRLAFSVIAHVDADILIVDEALSVGDAYFTQKCMRFIQRFQEKGSLLFVSHDANAILSLCNRALLINKGELKRIGTPKEVIEDYTKDLQKKSLADQNNKINRPERIKELENTANKKRREGIEYSQKNIENEMMKWSDYRCKLINSTNLANKIVITRFDETLTTRETYGGEKAEITNVELENLETDKTIDNIKGGEIVRLRLKFEARTAIGRPIIGFILKNSKGLTILGDNTNNSISENNDFNALEGDKVTTDFVFTVPMLQQGEYMISVSVADGCQAEHEILHWMNDALLLRSQCTSIAAGLAGVPMHSISIEIEK